jgi:hypothetical protein
MVRTVNATDDLERMVDRGATGLFTDFQDRAFEVLSAR